MQTFSNKPEISKLLTCIKQAMSTKAPQEITEKIKVGLEEIISSHNICLPSEALSPSKDCYARRLVHHDEKLGFVVVAMTWGPNQGTPIHDHDGIWCVEGVIKGQMEVTQYEIVDSKNTLVKLKETGRIAAGVGGAGALIPPYEHHKLTNMLTNEPSITLHIYGGDIKKCTAFIEQGNGWYKKEIKQLTYINVN